MPYFEGIPDKESQIGKVVGDIAAGLVYLAVIALVLDIVARTI